jgi:putative ABC transport system substrate-binding protein
MASGRLRPTVRKGLSDWVPGGKFRVRLQNAAGGISGGLREYGYVEGKNIIIEFRWADGRYDRLPELADELVRLKVDVLVTYGTPGGFAAKRATATIPIVMAVVGDAIGTGLVPSLARSGGNITGSTSYQSEVDTKHLELLKEIMPDITQVAVLLNPENPLNGPALRALETIAGPLKVQLQLFEARRLSDLDAIFSEVAARRIDAVQLTSDALFTLPSGARRIADLAANSRLPSIGFSGLAQAGGLISYGPDRYAPYQRAGYFVDRILKGANAADLPMEQPTKFELVINLKTAKELGLTIPPSILVRADELIE